MDDEEQRISRYDGAVLLLPYNMRERARSLDRHERLFCEEIRLRVGYTPTALMPEGEKDLGGDRITPRDMQNLMELNSGASVHAVAEQLAEGFLTVRGGYRIGVCGSVTVHDDGARSFKWCTSAAVRISREIKGVADSILRELVSGGEMPSVLIVSPPGGGKTTLMRDMVRLVSNGGDLMKSLRVSVCDERGEIAAVCDGRPQMDVGRHTDIMDSCPKAEAVMMLLRTMNPQLIAVDEITKPGDADALISAANCGVKLIATAHASSLDELRGRDTYRKLMSGGIFDRVVLIKNSGGKRTYVQERWNDRI